MKTIKLQNEPIARVVLFNEPVYKITASVGRNPSRLLYVYVHVNSSHFATKRAESYLEKLYSLWSVLQIEKLSTEPVCVEFV